MRRLSRSMIICCLLGAAMSIALACTLAWFRPLPRDASPRFCWRDDVGDAWMGFGERGVGWRTATLYGMTGVTDAGRAMTEPLPRWNRARSRSSARGGR